MTAATKTRAAVCKACGKPKRDCVLPCRLAVSAFTEDDRFVSWLKHVYLHLNAESDRMDPDRKHLGGAVAQSRTSTTRPRAWRRRSSTSRASTSRRSSDRARP